VTVEGLAGERLREAAEWRLISLLFECPSAVWRSSVAEMAGEVGDSDLREAAGRAQEEASEGLYHSTFGPGGPAPPREVTHRDMMQLGYLMSELDTYYRAFGFQPLGAEPPDHIAVEAGFVSYLKFKEAYALACGDGEAAAVVASGCAEFLKEHLSSIATPMAEALAGSGVLYLEAVARALALRTPVAKPRFVVLDGAAEDTETCGAC